MNDNPKRKRRILRSLRVDEISGVDRPAQAPAGALLRKNQGTNMNNPEDVIRDALAVRDDGAEPQFDADLYEQAILHEARLENSATETFAQVLARVASNGNDHVDALVFAAQRVRDREAAMGKAAAPSPVAEDAERVAKSGSSPRYTRDEYHDEMLSISKKLARPGEGVAASFARLAGDGAFDDLYAAGERAEEREMQAVIEKVAEGPDDRFHRALLNLAKYERRPSETIEGCYSRLLHENPTAREGYAAAQGM